MMRITESGSYNLSDVSSEWTIDTDKDIDLFFHTEAPAEAFIRIIKAGKLNIQADIRHDCSILFWNDDETSLETQESYRISRKAKMNVAYGECNSASTNRQVEVMLDHEGAETLLSTASLVDTEKNYRILVSNQKPKTIGNIRNHAVVLNHGRLMIDAVGKIVKGAKKSMSHQVSRALSFEEGQSAMILPELLIDENDVQASHAMSIGKVEEKELFYMMTRGLSIKECTKLISLGYLLPVTETLKDEQLKKTLQEELERKISELCMR